MIIVFMLGCAAGILAGAYLSLLAVNSTRKARKKKRRKEKRVREAEQVQETESIEEEEPTGLLKERLGNRKGTWTDFNCSADHVSEEEHIRTSRKKQNDAYRYVKNRRISE